MSASMRDYLDRTFDSGGPILWGGRHMKTMPKKREVFAVGKRDFRGIKVLRRRCMSCLRWLEPEPENLYKTTHGICGDCASLHYELRY